MELADIREALHRIRMEYVEMPEMKLTLAQMRRLLNLPLDACEVALASSDIHLEGKNSARLSILELRDVPSGLYEVRAVLSGPSGPIAASRQVVKIQPAPGRIR